MTKFLLPASCVLAAGIYIAVAALQYGAAYLAQQPNLADRQLAARIQPWNAEYRDHLGRYYFRAQELPRANEYFRAALKLNPHQSAYWLDLARSYRNSGNIEGQRNALENAMQVDGTTPDVAWEAADLFLSIGDTDRAMKEFRVVMENAPSLTPSALNLCWRARPDVDSLIRNVLPPLSRVYSDFLEILISKQQMDAAATVWHRLVELQQPVERRYIFEYLHALLGQRDVPQAQSVWHQSAKLSDLSSYQPSTENLIVNGDFSLPLLNAGFDWLYDKQPNITLSLDSTRSYFGPRSLLISFEGGPVTDAGIRQLVPVGSNTRFTFSAHFRTQSLQGAGGPQFVINDVFSGATYFTSDPIDGGETWKQLAGTFTTGPEARLIEVHIVKTPPGTASRGKIWIDGLRLTQAERGPS